VCAIPGPFKGRPASRDVAVGEREKGDTNSVSANSALVTGRRVSRTEMSRGQSRQPMSDRAPSKLRLRDRFVCLPNSVPFSPIAAIPLPADEWPWETALCPVKIRQYIYFDLHKHKSDDTEAK
jgi:hypothetical protein